MKEKSRLISFLYPQQNQDIVDALERKNCTVWAMELIPRISRAQVSFLSFFNFFSSSSLSPSIIDPPFFPSPLTL